MEIFSEICMHLLRLMFIYVNFNAALPRCKYPSFSLFICVQQNGEIDDDINQRIKVGWLKWKHAIGVLCDKRMPVGLKGKVYRTVV